jgi:hypothetical protein
MADLGKMPEPVKTAAMQLQNDVDEASARFGIPVDTE